MGEDRARERLRFHLEMHGRDFWFALVAGDDRRARQRLRGWVEGLGHPVHLHLPGAEALPDLAAALLDDVRPGVHWVITDAADLPRAVTEQEAGALLMALNERREALRHRLRGGLVVEGGHRLKVLLRNLAPDLFSIRACILEPGEPAPAVEPDAPWWVGEGWLDRDDVRRWGQPALPWGRWATASEGATAQARAALDEARRMAGRSERGARRSRLAALARATEALLAQGWVGEAAPAARDMLDLAQGLAEETEEIPPAGVSTGGGAWVTAMLAEAREASAVIARYQGDLAAAEEHWGRALELRRALVDGAVLDAATAPRFAALARAYSQIGEMALAEGDPVRAAEAFDHAVGLRARLVQASPEHPEWKAALALSWSLRCDLHLDRAELEQAAEACETALDLRRELVAEQPHDDRMAEALSVSLGRLARVRSALGDYEGAREAATDSLARIDALVDADPGNVRWQAQAAAARSRLGDATLAAGDAAAARDAWEAALHAWQDLCDEDPENAAWQHRLAIVYGRLGRLALAEGDDDEAAEHAAEARHLAEHLAWHDPTHATWQRTLAEGRLLAAEVASADDEAARLVALALDAIAHVRSLGAGLHVEVLADRAEALAADLGVLEYEE